MVLKIVGFVAIWTLYFIVTESASSIHNDMAEAYAWGREFQLGYNQHPPFWAWVCGAWFLIFPRANWAFAILSMLNAGVGLLGAWSLLGKFVNGDARIAATALLALTPFYTFLAYKYNANSIFLSLWPWIAYFLVGALRAREWKDSVGLGLVMGFALDSKYFSLTLAATCLIAATTAPEREKYFCSPSPYISIIIATTIWTPHLYWLYNTGAPPIRYLSRVSGHGLPATLAFAAAAAVGALLQQAFALGLPTALRGREERLVTRADGRLATVLALGPAALSVLAATVLRTKLSSNMLIGVFPLSPLLVISLMHPDIKRLKRWSLRAAAALSLGAVTLSPFVAVAKGWYGRIPEDWEPRREAALEAATFWRATTSAPLRLVAGSFRYDNAAVFYMHAAASVFVNFDFFGNRWVNAGRIVTDGLLTICRADDAVCLDRTQTFATPDTAREQVSLAHLAYGRARTPVQFVITAIPPR